jgi:hypothetical protein
MREVRLAFEIADGLVARVHVRAAPAREHSDTHDRDDTQDRGDAAAHVRRS